VSGPLRASHGAETPLVLDQLQAAHIQVGSCSQSSPAGKLFGVMGPQGRVKRSDAITLKLPMPSFARHCADWTADLNEALAHQLKVFGPPTDLRALAITVEAEPHSSFHTAGRASLLPFMTRSPDTWMVALFCSAGPRPRKQDRLRRQAHRV